MLSLAPGRTLHKVLFVMGPMDTLPLKTITYRGGIVRFRIPAAWSEEYEEAGGGTFYLPGADTGTLRLNVMTLQGRAGKPVTAGSAVEVLSASAEKYGVSVQPLREAVAMIRYDLSTAEQGKPLLIRYWQLAQALPPAHVRVVVFSYTSLSERATAPGFDAEVSSIEQEIIAAEFASVLGQTPPPPPKKRSWWQRGYRGPAAP
jgi:hypothetical protein